MNKQYIGIGFIIILIVLAIWGGNFYWENLRGVGPAIKSPSEDITNVIPPAQPSPITPSPMVPGMPSPSPVPPPVPDSNSTNMPLKLPAGFSISILAKNLGGVRDIEQDQFGNFWVSRPGAGAVTQLLIENGVVKSQADILKNLIKPHGLAFDPINRGALYIAEENKISRIATYSDQSKSDTIINLPAGGNHNYHSLGFGPDGRLYVKMGSSCNVCIEKDERQAKIFSLNKDGNDFKQFARGLRNAPFFTWHPTTKKMWATEMGRDFLGDDAPPDEINIVEEGKNYGWPNCYGKNIHDTDFDKNTYIRNPCMAPFEIPSHVDIPAHSAPLGLAFIPDSWPEEYRSDLLAAYHGSWNRSAPTGYKVVRMKFDSAGAYQGTEDFISGWIKGDAALGRPVDLLFAKDGALYITDDKAGVVYKVEYKK